jgi:hypothetical protein
MPGLEYPHVAVSHKGVQTHGFHASIRITGRISSVRLHHRHLRMTLSHTSHHCLLCAHAHNNDIKDNTKKGRVKMKFTGWT